MYALKKWQSSAVSKAQGSELMSKRFIEALLPLLYAYGVQAEFGKRSVG